MFRTWLMPEYLTSPGTCRSPLWTGATSRPGGRLRTRGSAPPDLRKLALDWPIEILRVLYREPDTNQTRESRQLHPAYPTAIEFACVRRPHGPTNQSRGG